MSFSYIRTDTKGRPIKYSLPYNPIEFGFKLTKDIPCCLYFSKGEFEIRIKAKSQILTIHRADGDDAINKDLLVPKDTKRFKQIMQDHGIDTSSPGPGS